MKLSMGKIGDYFLKYSSKTLFLSNNSERVTYSTVTELGTTSAFQQTHRRLVFCLAENDLSSLVGYLGLLVAEAVPLMLGSSISVAQLQQLITVYQPIYLWIPIHKKSEFAKLKKLKIVDSLITYGSYCLLNIANPVHNIHDSLALLLSTSGSTGSPKFVRLSHQNILSNAQSIAQYLALSPDEIPITTLPPSYSYGLSIIHSHVVVGATIAVTDQTFFDRPFWNFLRDVKATSLAGVPYHYKILKKLQFTKMNLPTLCTLTQAGGHMEPELIQEYAQHCASHGMNFFTMYGQTEATARMSYLPPDQAFAKAGSIGKAIPGGEFSLEDEAGKKIEAIGVPGELVYSGLNVSLGYAYGYEDLAKEDERYGVLRTGDLAQRDEDGDYYIVGRLSRFLKLFGNRINLLDVEKFLLTKGYEVACIGQDDHLEIYLSQGSLDQAKQIKTLVSQYLKVALQGVTIYGIESLPRSDSGKVSYSQLQANNAWYLA